MNYTILLKIRLKRFLRILIHLLKLIYLCLDLLFFGRQLVDGPQNLLKGILELRFLIQKAQQILIEGWVLLVYGDKTVAQELDLILAV